MNEDVSTETTSTGAGIQVIVPQQHEHFTRQVPFEMGDGRTLEARIVPYGVPAVVADPPQFMPYREMFMPGAFERQLKAPDRVKVWLNFEHEQGLRGIVGHGVELSDSTDGLRGKFRVHENADGDKALQMVNDGILTGLSLEFGAMKSRRVDGVTQRIRAYVDKVSLCRQEIAAYKGAEVLAVRTSVEIEPPKPMSEETLERLQRIGVEVLHRIAISKKPWDGSASRFTDEEYQASCLIDRGGNAPAKERCSLPVLEADGALNVNALGPAAARLNQVQGVSSEMRAAAARKLRRYYGQAGMQPPASLMGMAAR